MDLSNLKLLHFSALGFIKWLFVCSYSFINIFFLVFMAQLMKIVLLLKIRKKCTDKTLKDVNGETKNLPSNLKYMTEYKKVPLKKVLSLLIFGF